MPAPMEPQSHKESQYHIPVAASQAASLVVLGAFPFSLLNLGAGGHC